ncbi:MAG: hypothetical protein NTX50_02835 [Candidatus Sumerlaeota bacterium]|nr:hypothetical protein [Candidatus Sumerlaeota bacterium]
MIENEALNDKYQAQKRLAEEAGYDIATLDENVHKIALQLAEKYGVTLKYADSQGGYLEPLIKDAA